MFFSILNGLGAFLPLVKELISHIKGGRVTREELQEFVVSKRVSDFDRRQG